jgi:hypothetical protein
MGWMAFSAVALAVVTGFFGSIWYGLFVISKAISGKFYRSKEVDALRSEVAELRRELSAHLLNQDDEIERLGQRLQSVEQALPPLRAGSSASEAAERVRLQGP